MAKWKWPKSESVFDSAKPIYYLCRVFGWLPVKNSTTEKGAKRKYDRLSLVCLVFWVTLYVYYFVILLTYNFFELLNYSQVSNDVRYMLLCIGSVVSTITTFTMIFTRNKIYKGIDTLYNIDKEVKLLGITINHTKHHLFSFWYIVGSFMCLAVTITFSLSLDKCYDNFKVCFHSAFPLYFMSSTFTVFMCKFNLSILAVKNRFVVLNKCLRYNLIQKNAIVLPLNATDETVTIDHQKIVNRIAIMNKNLNDVVSTLNTCFAVQLMFVLASTFIFTAVGFFSLYRAYLRDASLVYLSLSYLLWVSYYWLHISFAIVVSSHTKSEGSVATGVEIHNAINHCNWPNVRKELKLYSLQLMHRCPNISCGLFPFDFTLFFSVVGGITTFLVILIQFDL